jgi:hypothetical protein
MRITIDFDNWDEMEAFRTSGKRTRGKGKDKDDGDENEAGPAQVATFTPPPTQTPATASAATGFQAPGGAAGFAPPNAAPAAPAIHPLVQPIIAKIDAALAAGQPEANVLGWLRQQLGAEAAQATMEQVKTVYLPKASEPILQSIAQPLGVK